MADWLIGLELFARGLSPAYLVGLLSTSNFYYHRTLYSIYTDKQFDMFYIQTDSHKLCKIISVQIYITQVKNQSVLVLACMLINDL